MLTRKEIAGIVGAIVLMIVILGILIVEPQYQKWRDAEKSTNWGFGPEWECHSNGYGEPICFKDSPLQR